MLYSTFVDLQSGFSLTRGFRQRKGQSPMGGDRERGEDIDFQIGVVKSPATSSLGRLTITSIRAAARPRRMAARSPSGRTSIKRAHPALSRGDRLSAERSRRRCRREDRGLVARADRYVVRTLTAHKDRILTDLDEVYRPRAAADEAMPHAIARPRRSPLEHRRRRRAPRQPPRPRRPLAGSRDPKRT